MHLETNEKIIKVIRKHPFYIILQTLGIAILALAPGIVSAIFSWLIALIPGDFGLSLSFSDFVSIQLQAFWYFLWLLFLWFVFLTQFTDYYLDKWVLTNKRIIDVEQRGFFIREVSSVRYPMIQDATIESAGLIATLLNFGTITIQTAGTVVEFKLPTAPQPLKNKELIIELKERFGK